LLVKNADWGSILRQPHPERWAGDYKVEGSLLLLPSNLETRAIPMLVDDIELLKHRLEELEDDIDVVLIDTSPTPSLLNAMIYIATDEMLHPTQTKMPSIQGLASSIVHLQRAKAARISLGHEATRLLGVIPTMHRDNTVAHRHGLKLIRDKFKARTWEPIKQSVIWDEAALMYQTLYAYAPEHSATDEAWHMVDQVQKGIAV